MKLVFVSTSINYPIHLKRFMAFQKLGVDVEVIGFEQQFGYPSDQQDIPAEIFKNARICGKIRAGHYLRRLVQFSGAILKIRNATRSSEVVYAIGFDGALLVRVSNIFRRNALLLVYEIHDIRQQMLGPSMTSRFFRMIERWLMRKVNILVVTASSYLSEYYQNVLGLTGIASFVMENKLLPHEIRHEPVPVPSSSPMKIGYIGSLRCNHAWKNLTSLVTKAEGAIEVEVWGVPTGIDGFHSDVESIPGLIYKGPFNDPKDIFDIYSRVSVVWIAGFQQKDSYGWARTCRFYNACCYKRPQIAQVGTIEGAIVENLGIGCCVDLRDIPGTIQRVMRISDSELRDWFDNIRKLPASLHEYSNEHEQLLHMCTRLCRETGCHE